MNRRWSVGVAVALLAVGCSSGDDGAVDPGVTSPPAVEGSAGRGSDADGAGTTRPEDRAVTIRTTGCGHASATTGSGVVVDRALVLTAAHVVAGATDVFVGESAEPATVFLLDRTRDLALIKAPSVVATPIELAGAAAGEPVRVVGGATSGTVDATVERVLSIDVDDVRSTSRSVRSGFELDAAIDGGDSGAGVFDGDGRLVGVVFAVPTARSDATFAVAATEVAAVLSAPAAGEHRCDPSTSRLVAPG